VEEWHLMEAHNFKPSRDYLLFSREYLTELQEDILRIQTSITIDEARGHAAHIIDKLNKKFLEKPIEGELTRLTERLNQQMRQQQ
jgi:hypothetical protein